MDNKARGIHPESEPIKGRENDQNQVIQSDRPTEKLGCNESTEGAKPEKMIDSPDAGPKPEKKKTRYYNRKPGRKALTQKQAMRIMELKARKIPHEEIARSVNTTLPAVNKLIERFGGVFAELENVKDFREARQDLIDAAQLKTLKSLVDPSKHADASLNQVAYAFDVLYKSNRLEAGKSTQNTAIQFFERAEDKDR